MHRRSFLRSADFDAGQRDGKLYLTGLLLVFVTRTIYLARFGWDPFWMNVNYLLEARGRALGAPEFSNGLPLVPAALGLLHRLGLSPSWSIGLLYELGHLAFAAAALHLVTFIWPELSRRGWWCFLFVLAFVPALAGQQGYKNLSLLLGAAFLLAGLALALLSARPTRLRTVQAAASCVLIILGVATRTEVLLCAALGAALLVYRSRSHAWSHAWLSASALAVGCVGGLGCVRWLRGPISAPAAIPSPSYAFYTFYDGLPWLLWPSTWERPGECGRYLASLRRFGSFGENRGSLVRALLAHPLQTALRLLLKPVDWLAVLGWIEGLTPLGLLCGGYGAYRWTRSTTVSQSWLLLTFLGAVPLLLVPPAAPNYFLVVLLPLLMAVALGLDGLWQRLSPGRRASRTVAVIAVALGLVSVGLWGKTETTTSQVFVPVADFLDRHCAAGCLTNRVPSALQALVWRDLEAGAPLPRGDHRSEPFALGAHDGEFRRGCGFVERMAQARRKGFRGPIYYLDIRLRSSVLADLEGNPWKKFEGEVDRRQARPVARFVSQGDEVVIYQFGGF